MVFVFSNLLKGLRETDAIKRQLIEKRVSRGAVSLESLSTVPFCVTPRVFIPHFHPPLVK